jgi:hypothetical protein
MAAIDWPADLPQSPLIDSVDGEQPDMAIRSQPEAGASRSRRRFSTTFETVQYRFQLTETQLAALATFYRTTLGGGVARFNFNCPGLGTKEVKFNGGYKKAFGYPFWIVAVQWIIYS